MGTREYEQSVAVLPCPGAHCAIKTDQVFTKFKYVILAARLVGDASNVGKAVA